MVSGAIFVRQHEYSIEITSPGGFPGEVTADNIMHICQPRNFLLAEALYRTGEVETAGYGVPRMFARAMEQCKPLPDFSKSKINQVTLELDCELVHSKLAEHMRHTPNMANYELTIDEYQALCAIVLAEPVAKEQRAARKKLLRDGIVKSSGRGAGTTYSLAIDSPRPPEMFNGDMEIATLILARVLAAGPDGIGFGRLDASIEGKSEKQVRRIANAMKQAGLLRIKGEKRGARWVATAKGKLYGETPETT